MSGGGVSTGSTGRGQSGSGFGGCSIMADHVCNVGADPRGDPGGHMSRPLHIESYEGMRGRPRVGRRQTSSPIARMSASALLCSTTPGRMR
jgi:hypothetical protein